MKKMNKKGFTLAELLIVVAIIAVLVAVAIPVFNAQLEKSRQATDLANIRSSYAEAMATYLLDGSGVGTAYKMQEKNATMDKVDLTNVDSLLKSAIDAAGFKDKTAAVSVGADASGNLVVSITRS